MRRAVQLISVFCVILMGTGCSRPLPPSGKIVPVSVRITCVGDTVNASIFPYIAQVPDSDGVTWNLVESPNVTAFEINKKKWNSAWPYSTRTPVKGDRERPAQASGMKAGLVGRKFSYNISAVCAIPGGEPRKIVIDPDMIIIRRPQSQ